MAFELDVVVGRRDTVGGPIVRINGSFKGLPGGAAAVFLMITDCTVTQRIKKLNPGKGHDAAFSLVAGELDGACQGLNPNADWYVYGQDNATPPDVSSAVKFPKGEKGHDSEAHDIKKLKQAPIKGIDQEIKRKKALIDKLGKSSTDDDKWALKAQGWGLGKVADLLAEHAAKKLDEAAKLGKEVEESESEKAQREEEYKRQFGEPVPGKNK